MNKKKKIVLTAFFLIVLGGGILFFLFSEKENSSSFRKKGYVEHELLLHYSNDADVIVRAREKVKRGMSFEEQKKLLQREIEKEIRRKTGDENTQVSIDLLLPEREKILTVKKYGMILVKVQSRNKTTEELQNIFSDIPGVQRSDPNYIFYANAENKNDMWNIFNNAFDAGISANAAWEEGYTGKGITVAVVDTGIDSTHPDLQNNIWKNRGEINCNDGIDNDGNGYIDDCKGWNFGGRALSGSCASQDIRIGGEENNETGNGNLHGTHVAGIIAATKNNTGVVGVSPDATLMPVKVFPDQETCTENDRIAKGIYYAIENGADIINISAGTPFTCAETNMIRQAVQAALEEGIFVVAATGNAGPGVPNSPALCDGVLGIGSTDANKNISPFSGSLNNMVDFVAPGSRILSTVPGKGYQVLDGTSMSTPHVSGVIALMLEKNNTLSPVQGEKLLCENANDLGEIGRDKLSGCGLVKVGRIMKKIKRKEKELPKSPGMPPNINIPPQNTKKNPQSPPGIGKPPLLHPKKDEEDPSKETEDTENPKENEGNPEKEDQNNPPPKEKEEFNSDPGNNTDIPKNPQQDKEREDKNNDDITKEEENDEERGGEERGGLRISPQQQITYPGCPIQEITVAGGSGKYHFEFGQTENMGIAHECNETGCTFSPAVSTGQATLNVYDGGVTLSSVIFSQPNPKEDFSFETSQCLKKCKNDNECIQSCMPTPTYCPENIIETPPLPKKKEDNIPADPQAPPRPNIGDEGEVPKVPKGNIPPNPGALPTLQPGEENPSNDNLFSPGLPPPNIPVWNMVQYKNCTEDITHTLSAQTDWNTVYVLRGNNQHTWQRAILSSPQGFLDVGSEKKIIIRGSALPYARVQIFFFQPQKNAPLPSRGTCIETTANASGYFSLPVHDTIFVEGLGEEMIFDAFFLRKEAWGTLTDAQKNSPSPLPPEKVKIRGVSPNSYCTQACDSGVLQTTTLSPSLFPEALLQRNHLPEIGSFSLFRGPGKMTFSMRAEGNFSSLSSYEKRILFEKIILAEKLKRFIYKNKETMDILHAILTEKEERKSAIHHLLSFWKGERESTLSFAHNEEKILDDILPKNVSEKTWKGELLESLALWTGDIRENICLLPKDDEEYTTPMHFIPTNLCKNSE